MPATVHTHYIPALVRTDAEGRMQTVCGAYIGPAQFSIEPTCWGCKVWIENLDVIEPVEPAEKVTA